MGSLFIATAVAAVIELIRKIDERDYKAVASIIGAAIVGALAGYFKIEVATVADGILAGLSASGLITLVQNFGKKRGEY